MTDSYYYSANAVIMRRAPWLATFLCLFATCVFADVFPITVSGNEADTQITIGVYQADLKIVFENVSGLDANALTITATQINPTDLLSRLTDPALISIPGQFPILINITPSVGSRLVFTGVVTIDLHTSNLAFTPALRLFTSPAGGTFDDITNFTGVGSYRVHGTGGGFSDFVITADVRNNDTVIQGKFSKLQDTLNNNAGQISTAMLQNLQYKYNAALLAYQSNNKDGAVNQLTAMNDTIVSDNGTSMPYTYRASDPTRKNVGGELRKIIATLIFSLRL
jgi:hypothetical protein